MTHGRLERCGGGFARDAEKRRDGVNHRVGVLQGEEPVEVAQEEVGGGRENIRQETRFRSLNARGEMDVASFVPAFTSRKAGLCVRMREARMQFLATTSLISRRRGSRITVNDFSSHRRSLARVAQRRQPLLHAQQPPISADEMSDDVKSGVENAIHHALPVLIFVERL